jgi:hypothetical protein
MAYIPRQPKSPDRVAITCRLSADMAKFLKQYAEFLESSQEHVVSETLRVAFRRDKEFQAWLTNKNAGGTDSGTSAPTSSSRVQHSVDSVSKAAASSRLALRTKME